MTKVTITEKLKKEIIPGINIFEMVLFSISTTVGVVFFILTILLWSNDSNTATLTNLITLIDIPVGVIAATFLAKRSKLAPLLLSIDALLYGSANIIAHQYALGFVNFIFTPILYMIAFVWIWPKQEREDSKEITTNKFNLVTGLLIVGGSLIIAIMFGVVITSFSDLTNNNSLPNWLFIFSAWFDSFAAALMLMAVITSVLRFRESWYFYFTSNILKIILFSTLIIYGDLSYIGLLILAITYFINALFGMLVWKDSNVVTLKKAED